MKCSSKKFSLNSVVDNPVISSVCCTNILKTVIGKEKFLATNKFYFSKSAFCHFGELSSNYKSNLTLLSANSFSLEESKIKICNLGKG